MTAILRVAALLAFFFATIICLLVEAPDVLDVLAAISVGLGLWVGSTLVDG